MCRKFLGKRKSRRHGEDSSRCSSSTEKAEIASEEVHSQSNIVFPALLLAAEGLPLTPIG